MKKPAKPRSPKLITVSERTLARELARAFSFGWSCRHVDGSVDAWSGTGIKHGVARLRASARRRRKEAR